MTDELTQAVGALTAIMLPAATAVARNWPAWERKPFPKPEAQYVDYVTLDELLDGPEITNGDAWCPAEERERLHAILRDRSRCWTCGTTSLVEAS